LHFLPAPTVITMSITHR